MSDARGCRRRDLDNGEAGDCRSDAHLDEAKEVLTAATPGAPGETMCELMERNEIRKRGWRSESPVAPGSWRSHIERTMRQQAQELTSVSNGSNPVVRFEVRIRTGTESWQRVLPHQNPDHCN